MAYRPRVVRGEGRRVVQHPRDESGKERHLMGKKRGSRWSTWQKPGTKDFPE